MSRQKGALGSNSLRRENGGRHIALAGAPARLFSFVHNDFRRPALLYSVAPPAVALRQNGKKTGELLAGFQERRRNRVGPRLFELSGTEGVLASWPQRQTRIFRSGNLARRRLHR